MNQLCNKIASNAPRETSGATSSNRFDFQKDWTICKLLDLSESNNEFLVLCDYHEDVTILNNEVNPTAVEFYQIKTDKKDTWTINRLIKRPKGKTGDLLSSILGKLCAHCLNFRESVSGLYFVSNANFNIELNDGRKSPGKEVIQYNELSLKEKLKVIDALILELNLERENSFEINLVFEKTDLSLNDHSNHTKGKLLEYLESKKRKDRHPVLSLYKTLFDEVKRRTNYEHSINDYEEIKRNKGISKRFFDNIITEAISSIDPTELLDDLSNRLRDEGVDLRKCIQIKNYFKEYEIERMDATNESLFRIKSLIEKGYYAFSMGQDNINLLELADKVKKYLEDQGVLENIERIIAILYWVINEELSI